MTDFCMFGYGKGNGKRPPGLKSPGRVRGGVRRLLHQRSAVEGTLIQLSRDFQKPIKEETDEPPKQ